MLGHTHPKNYGAVYSEIRAPFKDGPPYGEDYLRIRWFMYRYPGLISKFHIIMTPRDNQIGVFELKHDGIAIYHPVKYIE